MKNTAAPPINHKRHARILLWASLWLAWVSELLGGVFSRFRATRALEQSLNQRLDYMTRVIACSLLVQAAQRITKLRRGGGRRYGPRRDRAALTRAMIGREVRKLMRAPTPQARAALLAAILKNPERILRLLVARLERGLTRLVDLVTEKSVTHTHGAALAHASGFVSGCVSPILAAADTS